jgi:hypothetical protein
VIGMLATVALGGSVVLIGLAALVGIVDASAKRAAWNSIAAARRQLHHTRQMLGARETELDAREEELDARARRLHAAERLLDARSRAVERL